MTYEYWVIEVWQLPTTFWVITYLEAFKSPDSELRQLEKYQVRVSPIECPSFEQAMATSKEKTDLLGQNKF